MREDGKLYRLRTTPVELGADRTMTDPHPVSLTDYRPGHCRAVADINVNPEQCRRWMADRDNVRYIEYASPADANAVADGGRADRMLDWKSFEDNTIHVDGFAFLHDPARGDRIGGQQLPCLGCGIHWARRAVRESPSVIRVNVGDDDRARLQPFDPTEPIGTAIDDDTGIRRLDEKRAVAAMPPRFLLDVAAGTKKDEVHSTTSHP